MKYYNLAILAILLVLVVSLTACGSVSKKEVSVKDNVKAPVSEDLANSNNLEEISTVVCEEELGHIVYSANYNCNEGEIAVGIISEQASPAICCRTNI